MVIKKIIKAAAKKGLKSKNKARKVRSHPKPKVKSKATIERDRNQKKFVAMHKKVQAKPRVKRRVKRKAVVEAKRTAKWQKHDKAVFDRVKTREGMIGLDRDKERVKWDGISPKWRAGYTEKGRRDFDFTFNDIQKTAWGTPPTGMAKRSIENKLHNWRQDKITRDTEDAWRSGYTPYRLGKVATGTRKVRKAPKTVAGLDRDEWFIAGLAGSGPAIGAGYWENKDAINKLPGKAIDVIRDRRDALLRRLGLI